MRIVISLPTLLTILFFNYLSAQEYDLKKASEERNARARGTSKR